VASTTGKDKNDGNSKKKLTNYQVFVRHARKDRKLDMKSAAAEWRLLSDKEKEAFKDDGE